MFIRSNIRKLPVTPSAEPHIRILPPAGHLPAPIMNEHYTARTLYHRQQTDNLSSVSGVNEIESTVFPGISGKLIRIF